MSHNLYNEIMLQITKQILCFVVCTAITCGCTTTSTRTLLKYQDDGRHLTPIESYKIEKETTKQVRSRFKEVAFPIYRNMQYNGAAYDERAALYGAFFLWVIDLLSVPVAAVMFSTDKSVSYTTNLHARGKIVDLNNTPMAEETVKITENGKKTVIVTDERGVFEWKISHSTYEKPSEVVQIWLPNQNIEIDYESPFKQGNKFKIVTNGRVVGPSSLPARGNVIVLESPNSQPTVSAPLDVEEEKPIEDNQPRWFKNALKRTRANKWK